MVAHPGLYLMGKQFLRRRKALIDGAGDDARDLRDHLVAYLNGEIARAAWSRARWEAKHGREWRFEVLRAGLRLAG